MATSPLLLQYYSDLNIVQYRILPKAKDTIKLLVNQALCDGLPQEEQSCFNLDTALGAQLTILGRIVGVPRDVYGLDLAHSFFSFTRYVGTPASVGFGRYSDVPYGDDLWLRYNTRGSYTLTDFELRAMIKLKIIYNNTYSSYYGLKNALWLYFHGDIDIIDSGSSQDTSGWLYFNFTRYVGTPASNGFGRYSDVPYNTYHWDRYSYHLIMTVIYQVKSIYYNMWQAELFLNLVPKPMGVDVITVYN